MTSFSRCGFRFSRTYNRCVLESEEKETSAIILAFLALIWPDFLFSGSNMVISAYFTALHNPIASGVIAISRSLIFPVFLY